MHHDRTLALFSCLKLPSSILSRIWDRDKDLARLAGAVYFPPRNGSVPGVFARSFRLLIVGREKEKEEMGWEDWEKYCYFP
jgi:hypothetical protein